MDDRKMLLLHAMDTLEAYGYECSESCFLGHTCFDLFARKEGRLLILKIVSNIDSLTHAQVKEMRKISSLLEGSPLVIGMRRRAGAMEDGVAYNRNGVFAVSLITFSRFLEGDFPYAESCRGGYFVELDSRTLLQNRKEAEMSRREVASLAGVSSRRIFDYEMSRTRASMKVAHRLEEILEARLARGINLYQECTWEEEPQLDYNPFEKLSSLGLKVFLVHKAPLSGVVKEEGSEPLLTKKMGAPGSFNRTKIQLLKSMADVASTRAFLVSKKNKKNIRGLPHLREEEFEGIEGTDDFFALLEDRCS